MNIPDKNIYIKEVAHKQCFKCKILKPLNQFIKDKRNTDGRQGVCRKCVGERQKELKKLYSKRYKRYAKTTRDNCREHRLQYNREYHLKNRERRLAYGKERRNKTKESRAVYNKQYRLEHKEETRQYQRIYSKKRRKNNPQFRFGQSLRGRIRKALRGINKAAKTEELLGCTILELRKHLESQFKERMTWDTYGHGIGKWNVDHIIPCFSFDLTEELQQKKCFNYNNLQPMWYLENIRKGAKIFA